MYPGFQYGNPSPMMPLWQGQGQNQRSPWPNQMQPWQMQAPPWQNQMQAPPWQNQMQPWQNQMPPTNARNPSPELNLILKSDSSNCVNGVCPMSPKRAESKKRVKFHKESETTSSTASSKINKGQLCIMVVLGLIVIFGAIFLCVYFMHHFGVIK